MNHSSVGSLPPDAKLQVTKGYAPQFGQVCRLLAYVASRASDSRIPPDDIVAGTGLSRPHVENMGSLAAAMGLLLPRTYLLTDLGEVAQQHDPFFDNAGTLWCCHYTIASNPRHVIWNRYCNTVLIQARGPIALVPEHFADLEGDYTEVTLLKHVRKEIRSFARAYTVHRFRNLDYLLESDGRYYLADNPAPVPPLILMATIVAYRDAVQPGASGMEIPLLCSGENSPGRILHLSEWKLRESLEVLHRAGRVTIESRANLDQIRFDASLTPAQLLADYYRER